MSDARSIHTRRWRDSLVERGHQVAIASFREPEYPTQSIFFKLNNFGLGKLGYFFSVPQLNKIGKIFKPDIVYAHYVTSYGFLCAAAGLKPLVVTAWGSDILVSPKVSWVSKMLVRFALGKCDVVTTVAEHMTNEVCRLGINKNKIYTTPFGVNLRVFKRNDHDDQLNDSLNKLKPIVISTRNFAEVYNISTLINAVGILKSKNILLELWLVGDGVLRKELENQVEFLGLKNETVFWGHVQQEKLAELLIGSDIFVSTAISDGNNISLNEAMACGVFPIVSNIEANTQWIKHGENGFLFDVKNSEALAKCIESGLVSRDLRGRAKLINLEIVHKHASWDKCVDDVEKIFVTLKSKYGR